jgi:indolepyruvate ferredoxin oxidoreductase beta subunit
MDVSMLETIAGKAAKRFVCFDMQAAADATGSVISSVLLGAIAASGVLPFSREQFEETIRNAGKAVEANLRGFAAGYDGPARQAPDEVPSGDAIVEGSNGEALAMRIRSDLPEAVRRLALHGALKVLDYQDARYADAYVDALLPLVAVDQEDRGYALSNEVARQLALQMTYEDTIRVAELKTRGSRFERIRAHIGAAEGQPVKVIEYFHPRLEEFCDTLPDAIGRAILGSPGWRKLLGPLFSRGRNLTTTSISGFLFLHGIAKLKRFRRGSHRFVRQQKFIRDWLQRIGKLAGEDYDHALAVARCIELVKGYGDTYERGLTRYEAIMAVADSAAAVERLRQAALADEQGVVFDRELAAREAAA